MRRFPEEPTPRRGRCVAPSREQNGEQRAPRTQKKRKKPPLAARAEQPAQVSSKTSSSRSSLSQPKQKASEGLNANASQAGPDGLPSDYSLPKQKAYYSHGTQHSNSALPRDSAHELCTRDSERDSSRTLPRDSHHEQRKDLLFILLRPLPRARRDSCPRDPSPRSTTGGRELLTS